MVKRLWKNLFTVVSVGLLVSCASMQPEPKKMEPAFVPQQIQGTCYEQKTDNFLVLLDASGSMGEKYKGQTKFATAEQIVSRMNQTIPGGMSLKAAVRTFGAGFSSDTKSTFGPGAYSKEGLEASLGKVSYGGFTPIGHAVNASGVDKASLSGTSAVILVSDGKQNVGEDAVKAAKMVKEKFGDKVCFYTILVGDDPAGKATMEEIANTGNCGFATTADAVYSSEGMASFVKGAFCGGQPPAPARRCGCHWRQRRRRDTRQRGQVPQYAQGGHGQPIRLLGLPGRDFIRLQQIRRQTRQPIRSSTKRSWFIEKNPGLKVEIQGYTDSIGTEEYNLGLSERRADAVEELSGRQRRRSEYQSPLKDMESRTPWPRMIPRKAAPRTAGSSSGQLNKSR